MKKLLKIMETIGKLFESNIVTCSNNFFTDPIVFFFYKKLTTVG